MNIKKFLSMFLSLTLILNFVNITKCYANASKFNEEEFLASCPKNAKGGHESISCAKIAAKNIIKEEGKDYLVMENIGSLADQELYVFTFRALDKILDILGLDPNEDELRKEWKNLKKVKISYFSPLKNILKVSVGSLIGALGGNGLYNLARSEHRKHHKYRIQFLRRPAEAIYKLGVGMMNFIGAAFVGLITSIMLKIKYDAAQTKESEIFNRQRKIYKLNNKKADALDFILHHIKHSNYLSEENFFTVHAKPKEIWNFDFGNLEGLNYTEEEKALFPEKLKKLAQDIEKNLGRRLEKKDEQ